MLDAAATLGPQGTETVRVIDHQPCTLGPGFPGQRWQIGNVAVHAEHAVGDDQRIAGGFFQALGQAHRVVVQVAIEPRAGQQPRVEQRRMIEPVFEHRIALPHQRRDRTEVGHVAGGEQQGTRATGEVGQGFFQGVMRGAVADDQMRSPATHAPLRSPGAPGFDHLRVIGQAQVIVVTERQQWLAVDHYLRALRALQQWTLAVEVFSTTGSQACGEIERHAGLGVRSQSAKVARSPVGASLLAMTDCHSTLTSIDLTPSPAGWLPQVLHFFRRIGGQTAAL
ncbi:hypothetical protein D3C76_965100 [compost metagenome]